MNIFCWLCAGTLAALAVGCSETAAIQTSTPGGAVAACADLAGADVHLRLATDLGDIHIDLYERAAPASVRLIANLVCYGTTEPAAGAQQVAAGYYDGQVFDYTHPNIEVRISIPEGDDIRIPKEINADSLGLHEQIVTSQGVAMDMYQFVVFKEFAGNKRSPDHSPQLRAWIAEYDQTQNPKFLIGRSRKDINTVLGYAYTERVTSYPIKRGSVLLEAASKAHSSPRLVMALDALPNQLGKWTVVGQVVDGLDIVEQLSKAPSTGMVKPRWRPIEPVVIEHADFVPARPNP